MAPIQMRNLTTFPSERLCFDLKLELLEQLNAKGVIELVKVNQGFQGMISNRPLIVFGNHVDDIGFGFDPHGIEAIYIKKLNWKSLKVNLDVICHFPFIKNIRSCGGLCMDVDYHDRIDKDHATFLRQLEAVNSLDLKDYSRQCLKLLSHLSIKIKRYAGLPSMARAIKDVGHFIETRLNECEIVDFDCGHDEGFQFYYNASKKTHIKSVEFGCCYSQGFIVPAIQWIVSHGIPSKDPAAVVRVFGILWMEDDMWDTIAVFLTGYPGMKQIKGKDRRPLFALAMERSMGSRYPVFTTQTLCFRRNINATRDCIYFLSSGQIKQSIDIDFFAFYIKPDEMIDH